MNDVKTSTHTPIRASSKRLFRAMGTESYIEIIHSGSTEEKVLSENTIEKAVQLCFDKVQIFSRFDTESELSNLNQQLETFTNASPDMLSVALHALDYFDESNGLYDPRILPVLEDIGYHIDFETKKTSYSSPEKTIELPKNPLSHDLKIWGERIRFGSRIDFSGIAKGYILDKMAEAIHQDGWRNFLVDSGGDMFMSGTNNEGEPWRIAVENIPEQELMMKLSEHGIATSGITRRQWMAGGERYHHLIHPKHPYAFTFDLLSVTTLAPSAERADFLAKTLFLMGVKTGLNYAEKHHLPAVFVKSNNHYQLTRAMKPYRL